VEVIPAVVAEEVIGNGISRIRGYCHNNNLVRRTYINKLNPFGNR
jgi:hypothetical protein